MFFGQKIIQNEAFEITFPKDSCQFILSNITLDVKSQESQIYLKIKDKQILLLQLDRKINLINSTMLINICTEEKSEFISKKGNVYVCGHFIHKNKTQKDIIKSNNVNFTHTPNNKLIIDKKQEQQVNSLKFVVKPSTTVSNEQSSLVARRSSRLSTRVNSNQQKITKLSITKKQQKQMKKQQKQKLPESKNTNGRASLKALLNSIDNDQDDSDQQFDEPSSQQSDEDDSSQNSNQSQQQTVKTSKIQLSTNIKQDNKQLTDKNECNKQLKYKNQYNKQTTNKYIKQNTVNQAIVQTNRQKQQKQIGQITLQKNDSKCAENQNQSSNILIDEQIMQQLATTIKVPIKRPTI